MYDPTSEAHEFLGRDRSEAVAKATTFFSAAEADLAIAEVDAAQVSGLGTRVAIVAYRRDAGPPGRRSPERAADRGDRPERDRGERGEGRRMRDRDDRGRGGRGRDRGERGDRGDRDRAPRGRDDGEGRDRGRSRDRERDREPSVAEAPEEVGPSAGTATSPLGEIGTFVCGLVERMGVGSFEISESSEGDMIAIQLGGAAALRLASGDGRAVDALQLLANQASMRSGGDDAKRVVLDVEGNADEREAFLTRIAQRAADRARQTGRPVALEAMSPKDRRTVHVALRDAEGIATMSVGDGRYRQVVVVPDSAPEYEEAKRYESQSQGRD